MIEASVKAAAIEWTMRAHARNIAAISLESQQTAVVESIGSSERAAREAIAQEHPEAELLSVHERSDRETWVARGRVAKK